jgi:mono/diheme cytochrome c family protein
MATATLVAALGMMPFVASGEQNTAAIGANIIQRGATIFTDNCVDCHQASGVGRPPSFPALAENAKLKDLVFVVGNIHSGRNAMPPFYHLGNEDIAAVATYVRNTWGNGFGATTPDEVATIVSSLPPAESLENSTTIWDGIFTEAQAGRGQQIYMGTCAKCHGERLNGAAQPDQPPSPAIARSGFIKNWSERSAETLFAYLKTTMPKDNPGQLSDQQATDVLAHMLAVSGANPGGSELPIDPVALRQIAIVEKPE